MAATGDAYSVASLPVGTYDISYQAESPPVPPPNGTDIGSAAIAGHSDATLAPGPNTVDLS